MTLHAKDRPVFVSDVTEPDLPITLKWLEAQGGGAMAGRLTAALNDGRLCITSPPFYTGPLPFWEMPASLMLAYAASALVITKGDANYRRLLGDLHWAHDTPFSKVRVRVRVRVRVGLGLGLGLGLGPALGARHAVQRRAQPCPN